MLPAHHHALLKLVERSADSVTRPKLSPPTPLEKLGLGASRATANTLGFLSFMGLFAVEGTPQIIKPWRLRWKQITAEIQKSGVTALPIVGLLAFLMGVVVAYQGGVALDLYGANVFLVELVGITMLREMSPLLAAIVVAGRTGSAYAAQIGTMKITEEIDALRSLGIPPFEVLALPKLLALGIALPLLTVFADILGLLGGMAVANAFFGISTTIFIDRLPAQLPTSTFWLGLVKTPVFAAIITLVGCYHGFQASGSAESVGRATTASVVQGIFWVIVTDAMFSILFQLVGL
jgi:phospholipid/cholesterol/gamma-HCH transport system permease protein